MQDFTTKTNRLSTLDASEFNNLAQELEHVISSLNEPLDGTLTNQLAKAIASYASSGDYYTDSGTANTYVLTVVGSREAPSGFFTGMRVAFLATNANTGASTINVSSLGSRNIVGIDGTSALASGDISTGQITRLWYDGTNFRLDSSSSSSSKDLIIEGGLVTNNTTDSAHDIDIAPLHYVNNATGIEGRIASTLTKRCDADWAEGNNQGANFPSGALASATRYGIYLIRKDSDGTLDVIRSTSTNDSDTPSGWTRLHLIWWLFTNTADDNIAQFDGYENGRRRGFIFARARSLLNGNVGTAGTTVSGASHAPPNSFALLFGRYSGSSTSAIELHLERGIDGDGRRIINASLDPLPFSEVTFPLGDTSSLIVQRDAGNAVNVQLNLSGAEFSI